MKQEINNITETRKEIIVTLSSEEINTIDNQIFAEFSKHAQLPGFRPGKAPKDMIRKKHATQINEELQKRIISNVYQEIQNNKEIKIYNVVDLKDPVITKDQDIPVAFTVDIWPTFELPQYDKLEIKQEEIKVTPEEIKEAITKMQEQMAEYTSVERPAKEGDYVRLSYEGNIDGAPVADIAPENPLFSKQDRTWEQAGKNEEEFAVSSICEGLVGMSADATKEVTHTFPTKFKIEALSGKTATYNITVHEVKEKTLPEVNDAFFKRVAVESMDQLNKKVEDDFIRSKEQRNTYSKREQIIKAMENEADFPLPQGALDEEKARTVYSILQKRMQAGESEEDLQAVKGDIEEEGLQEATKALKVRLILAKVSENEKLEVNNQEIYSELMKQAYMTRKPIEEIIEHIKKDRQALLAVQQEALFYKTLDFLSEKATIVKEESVSNS